MVKYIIRNINIKKGGKYMVFKGKTLILDNFRTVLSDYSLDVQDVVRSAILDGIDISAYIQSCKENPFRLDQIRLGMKDGLSEAIYKITNGNVIYQIRILKCKGVDLKSLEKQLEQGNLSETYMIYALNWIEQGINLSKINLAIIPQKLLPTFEYGLKSGFDMSKYNNGVTYSPQYIGLCLQIEKSNKSVSFLLKGDWSIDILEVLSSFSRVENTLWNNLTTNIDRNISKTRIKKLIRLVKVNIDITPLQKKSGGEYIFSDKCLDMIEEAYYDKLNYKHLIEEFTNEDDMAYELQSMQVSSRKNVRGRLRKSGKNL